MLSGKRGKYAFSISPIGKGLDCHRTCELDVGTDCDCARQVPSTTYMKDCPNMVGTDEAQNIR